MEKILLSTSGKVGRAPALSSSSLFTPKKSPAKSDTSTHTLILPKTSAGKERRRRRQMCLQKYSLIFMERREEGGGPPAEESNLLSSSLSLNARSPPKKSFRSGA